MKHLFTITVAAMAMSGCSGVAAPGIHPGSWHAEIPETKALFGINILNDSTVTCDAPLQRLRNIPGDVVYFAGDSIVVNFPTLRTDFGARLEKDGNLAASLSAGESRQLFVMTPYDNEAATRPQTPMPPFPYPCDEISATVAGAKLHGTFIQPPQATYAVLFVNADTADNRDAKIRGHRPYAVIADLLGRTGMASLRYDNRGTGASTSDGTAAPSAARLLDDARAMLAGLRANGQFKHVGVIGIGDGAVNALRLAPEADFAVALAAPLLSAPDSINSQLKSSLPATSTPIVAIYGDRDSISDPQSCINFLSSLNPRVRTVLLPGLDNMLRPAERDSALRRSDSELTIDRDLLRELSGYIESSIIGPIKKTADKSQIKL